jgi:hypothetical protein
MKLYRFSPITSKEELLKAVEHIHFESFKLCWQSFKKYLPNSGNMGIFCHYQDEYEKLTKLRKELTESSENFNQKYFRLHEPLVIPSRDDVPETNYEFLYVRQPDPYRHHVGDIDFYLEESEYENKKNEVKNGNIPGARDFPSPLLEMIELFNPDSDVLAYVSTKMMTDLVRTTKSGS